MIDPTHLRNPDFEPRDEELVTLSLALPTTPPPPPPPPPQDPPQLQPSPPSPPHQNGLNGVQHSQRASRARGPPSQTLKPGQSEIIDPPYPWATNLRARVHPLKYLLSDEINIRIISGELYCKRCDRQFEIHYNLEEKFSEVAAFILANKDAMHDRAPPSWLNPTFPACIYCNQPNMVKPIINKKKSTNWLFLFLGQMIGVCKLNELKYFCKHTGIHRTGAKDRVLYYTYIELYNQVDPGGEYF